ncbi:hypothetical protein NKI88_31180 [Mesorhizobium sp. M0317]|uniref:hypothetical protein n=1 Tax=unclassified Mesorhizobium TaxID=325217 RepID=UPI0033353450
MTFRASEFCELLRVRFLTVIAASLLLLNCSTPRVDLKDTGSLSGLVMVFWVGEDNFVYYPFYKDPLVYHLPKSLSAKLGYDAIRPGLHYNDGGSIPRAVRGVEGFSPWGYGPAYVVHDWIFAARHCLGTGQSDRLDDRDELEAEKVKKIDFPTSADILAGVIGALVVEKRVPPRAVAPGAIYTAVDSFVARRIWDDEDPDTCKPVSEKHLKAIEAAISNKRLAISGIEGQEPPVLVFQQTF